MGKRLNAPRKAEPAWQSAVMSNGQRRFAVRDRGADAYLKCDGGWTQNAEDELLLYDTGAEAGAAARALGPLTGLSLEVVPAPLRPVETLAVGMDAALAETRELLKKYRELSDGLVEDCRKESETIRQEERAQLAHMANQINNFCEQFEHLRLYVQQSVPVIVRDNVEKYLKNLTKKPSGENLCTNALPTEPAR